MAEFFENHSGPEVAALSALLAALIALTIYQRNQFNAASASFRAAFSQSLTALLHTDADTCSVLQAAFPAHEMAVLEFARHLSWFSRRRFLVAWRDYHQVNGIPFFEQYSRVVATGPGVLPREERRPLAIRRIEILLAYAKP